MATARGLAGRHLDVVLVLVLVVAAVPQRWAARPTVGLFHDDAWVAATALHGEPSRLLAIGVNQPGFTGLLMALRWLGVDDASDLVWPALVAGVVGPAALFAMLRWARFARPIAIVMAVVTLVDPVHVRVSARVKPFTIELLIVVVLAVVVDALSKRRWNVRVAVGWVVAAVMLSTVGAFAFLGTSVAGATLLLRRRGDLRLRVSAFASQTLVSIAYLAAVQRNHGADRLEEWWGAPKLDALIGFDRNPLRTASGVIDHLGQVVAGNTGLSQWAACVVGVVALAGLVHAARPSDAAAARFLGLLMAAAIALSVMEKLPLGSATDGGLRVSTWTIPPLTFGVAHVISIGRNSVTSRGSGAVPFDVACLGFAAVVAFSGFGNHLRYPAGGTKPATDFVEQEVRSDDRVLLLHTARFAFAAQSDFDVAIENDTSRLNGLALRFHDPRIIGERLPTNPSSNPPVMIDAIGPAPRVLVVTGIDLEGRDPISRAAPVLTLAGLIRTRDHKFGTATVSVWERLDT